MMNPQYPLQGQNNNAPSNPIFPPISQEYNGVQNANFYSQVPSNGQKPMDQTDMSQKMQNMNINGPQGFPSIPPTQLPPGQVPFGQYPQGNFAPGQLPPGQRPPGMSDRPPVSGAPVMPSTGPNPQMPPMSTSGGPQGYPQSLTPNIEQNRQFQPPSSMHSQLRPPSAQPNQGIPPVVQQPSAFTSQMPSMAQSNQIPQQAMGRPSMPSQGIQPPKPGIPAQPQMGGPAMQTGQTGLQGIPQQLNAPPQSQPSPISQPGMPIQNRAGLSGPPSMMSPGMIPQPGQIPSQSGPHSQLSQQPSKLHDQGSQLPPPGIGSPSSGQQISGQPAMLQPGQMSHPGLIPQPVPQTLPPGQSQLGQPGNPQQPGQMLGQSPLLGPMPGQPGLSRQGGQMPGPPGAPGQMSGQPGLLPGQMQQGLPSQPGFPPQAGQLPQQQSMTGMPHMPPPLSQQKQQYPAMPPVSQAGYGTQPGGQFPSMPPMPGQMPPQPMPPQPMPGQQRGYQQPSSGYPPQYQAQYPAQQPPYPGQQYQPPEQKRLDPEQMPSPIQVMSQDQQNRSGIFVTNEKGLVPPLATTDFVVDDKGNASPRYIRSSMYTVPVTADLLKQTSMPFCLVISPMAETIGSEPEPPLIDFAALTGSPTMGPVRCSRCKAYMCPNMKFIDAGRHFKCAFCKATTEVPMEYTQYVNSTQQYGRVPAEMALGTYEIVATKEYCRNNTLPNPPAIVFVIDVSYNSIKNGLVQTICDNILEIIESLPRDEQTGKSWTRVGFITYSSTVHFYNIKGTLAQPQMMSVGDVGDMFVPLLEGFLVLPEESGPVLQALLQQLPNMFRDNKETETILLPACQAGLEALKAADTSGQLLVFHTTLPSFNAPGKLINREDRKLLGTDKEKQILNPQTTAYNELGQSCSAAGVCVELFVCNNSYVDCATIGQVARLTGGQLHKYTYFTSELDGARLMYDVERVMTRSTAHDAVMRVRTSTGVRPTEFYGHLFMSNTTDVELAAVDADKAIGIEIKHDDKLTAEDGVYIQAALLYTHRSGQRRLRVINLALNVAHQLADVYRSMELDTCINFLTKQAVWALREHSPRQVRDTLSTRCARSLAAYRRHCASPSSAGQLVLPEPMKLLPLYTNCVLRSDAVAGGPDITCDDRSCAMYRALTADVNLSVVYTYPRLLPLISLADENTRHIQPLRASVDKINDQGVYLLENGVHMLVWVGSQAPSEFIRDVFGVTSPQQIDPQVAELPALDTPASRAVRGLLDDVRASRRNAMRLTIMRQHDKLETVLRHFLVEDRGVDGSSSYVDYLCYVHKEIRALL